MLIAGAIVAVKYVNTSNEKSARFRPVKCCHCCSMWIGKSKLAFSLILFLMIVDLSSHVYFGSVYLEMLTEKG